VGDKDAVGKLKTVPEPGKLPVVLSREEVARLLEATSSLKYRWTMLTVRTSCLFLNQDLSIASGL
jgi:hypothetical protein